MKVTFSKITYTEVKEKRAEVLKNSQSLKGLAEQSVHYIIKRIPFLLLFLLYADFVIDKSLVRILGTVYKYFNEIFERKYQTWFASDVSSLMAISLTLVVAGSVFAIILGVGYKVVFFVANNLLPRKNTNL